MALATGLAGAALVSLPTMASAASTCSYNPVSQNVSVSDASGGAPLRITRLGQSIAVADGSASPQPCGAATVTNTNGIVVGGTAGITGLDGYNIDYSQGPLAPGASPEFDGNSEIEVVIHQVPGDFTGLRFFGTPGPDVIRASGRHAIMVGPDTDLDVVELVPPDGRGLFRPGNAAFIQIDGGGGDDFISGRGGYPQSSPPAAQAPLVLNGQGGSDTLVDGLAECCDTLGGGTENDTLFSVDGHGDLNNGGDGFDKASIDANNLDGAQNVESVSRFTVGRLRLSPAVVKSRAGKVAHLEMSWTHPKAWRELRKVEVRLHRGTDRTATITLRPGSEQIRGRGDVRLIAGASRISHRGKTVSARLAVRLPKAMAGEQLRVDVEATDRHGHRQLEPSAGLIKIAR